MEGTQANNNDGSKLPSRRANSDWTACIVGTVQVKFTSLPIQQRNAFDHLIIMVLHYLFFG